MQKKAGDCEESSDALRSPLLLRARTISMRRVSVKAYTLSHKADDLCDPKSI